MGENLEDDAERYIACCLDKIERVLAADLQAERIRSLMPELQKPLHDASALESSLEELLAPLKSLILLPGKRWRPLIFTVHLEMGEASPQTEHYSYLSCIEILHNATLIADDIEDQGSMRRGQPAVHIRYGLDRALNSCNWGYFLAPAYLRHPEKEIKQRAHNLYQQCLRQIHLGQALDIQWHRQRDYFPSPEAYLEMASLKTGALASFSAQLGCLPWAEEPLQIKLAQFWRKFGTAFQVLDDLLNLLHRDMGKVFADDLIEGKKSLPFCHFAKTSPSKGKEWLASQMLELRQLHDAYVAGHRSKEELEARIISSLNQFYELSEGRAAMQKSYQQLLAMYQDLEKDFSQLYREGIHKNALARIMEKLKRNLEQAESSGSNILFRD